MQVQFTKQDALTFLIGLAVGVGWEIGDAFVGAEVLFADWESWAKALGIGLMTSTGRWIATYLGLKGFTRQ